MYIYFHVPLLVTFLRFLPFNVTTFGFSQLSPVRVSVNRNEKLEGIKNINQRGLQQKICYREKWDREGLF